MPSLDVEDIRLMYRYDLWVNQRLLAVVAQLPAERAKEPLGSSFDSIHGTLGHILGSQIHWLNRWRRLPPTRQLGGGDFDSLDAIRARWHEHQRDLDAFLGDLTQERLTETIRYTRSSGRVNELPLRQLMLHVVNHGTHHRSELADMLTRLGYPPPPTDLVQYCLEETRQ
ncbi:MAG: DinB family protein [Chloroflexi bacterium]|nr:DinB family protein [Chloroflexota bacterium]